MNYKFTIMYQNYIFTFNTKACRYSNSSDLKQKKTVVEEKNVASEINEPGK